jgi:tetratricopeptide (TPR) repeat protein
LNAEGQPVTPSAGAEQSQSALYWRMREAAAPPQAGNAGAALPPATSPARPQGKGAGGASDQAAGPAEAEQAPGIPPAPERLPTNPPSFADCFARAQAAMKAGNYAAADALYEAATVMDADQPPAFFGRINALLGGYRYMVAALVLDRGLRLHPEWARDLPDVKAAFNKPETYDRVVNDLTEDLKVHPQALESNLLMGYLCLASGKTAEAKPYLGQVSQVRAAAPGSERAMLEAINPPPPGK